MNLPKTPFYYYDIPLLERTLQTIRDVTQEDSQFCVHYAVKANNNPHILQTIAGKGFGADCVSGGEIKQAVAAGIPADKIVFAGVGKTDDEIDFALKQGIGCFNVESMPELRVINERALAFGKIANIAFRVNPNIDAHTHQKITTGLNENKFGITIPQLIRSIKEAEKLEGVKFCGLHFHIGSQITDVETFKPLCECVNELQTLMEENNIWAPSINVGGGLGIDYKNPKQNPLPDFEAYFKIFRENLFIRPGQTLHFELGRSIVAQCGTLVSKVLYVKEGVEKKFIILDAGFTDMARVAMYDAYHDMENLTPETQTQQYYDVVGPICESSDVFAQHRLLHVTKRGDIFALRSAGAYGEVMSSKYNSRELPKPYSTQDFDLETVLKGS